jgi:hypothetical protein
VEVDPWGQSITCTESVWAKKAAARAELVAHEEAIRATIRDPDQLYVDGESSAIRAVRSGSDKILRVHYLSEHRAHGRQAGNLLSVVVKWEGEDTAIRGYFTTAYLPNRLQRRLQLRWRRPE